MKIKNLNIHVYDSGNISIVEGFGTGNNKQVAYYNVTEKQWYVNGDSSLVALIKYTE